MTYENVERDWKALLAHMSDLQSKYSLTSATLILSVDWRDLIASRTNFGSHARYNSKLPYMSVNITFGKIESRDAITYY